MGLKDVGKDPLLPDVYGHHKEESACFWTLFVLFVVTGLSLFAYGFSTPDFVHHRVEAYDKRVCWERRVGLWEECIKQCKEKDCLWNCKAWGPGTTPEDISVATNLQVSGLLLAMCGFLGLAFRCTRYREHTFLGVAALNIAAGIIPAIGSTYLVLSQSGDLNRVGDDLEGNSHVTSRVQISFILNTIGCGVFLVAGFFSLWKWRQYK